MKPCSTIRFALIGIGVLCAASPAHGASGDPGAAERTRRSSCGPFVLTYPARLEAMAGAVEEFLCESTGGIAAELGLESIDTIAVLIAPETSRYRTQHGGRLPDWSAAYSDIRSQVLGIDSRAVVRMRRPIRTVMRHELSHLLFAQRVGGVRCPAWFMEGLAMMQSEEWSFGDQWRFARNAARREIPYLDDLEGRFPDDAEAASFAYGVSYTAVRELLAERAEDLITLTAFVRELGSFDEAFATTFGETLEHFDGRLHVIVRKRYRNIGVMIQTTPYWLPLTLLFLLAAAVKRYRSRRRLAEWEREGL
jgi:hypothetical protein